MNYPQSLAAIKSSGNSAKIHHAGASSAPEKQGFSGSQRSSKDEHWYNTFCLVPQNYPYPHYLLLADKKSNIDDNFIAQLEQNLCQNPQYLYARKINQLGAIKLKIIPDLLSSYSSYLEKNQTKAGNIKPPILLDLATYQNWQLNN